MGLVRLGMAMGRYGSGFAPPRSAPTCLETRTKNPVYCPALSTLTGTRLTRLDSFCFFCSWHQTQTQTQRSACRSSARAHGHTSQKLCIDRHGHGVWAWAQARRRFSSSIIDKIRRES
jgi:hypothetical protein